MRATTITPSNNWSHDNNPSLLGLSIRYASLDSLPVWHVLEVTEGSPAQLSGLKSYSDYIIGCQESLLTQEEDLFSLIESHNGRQITLFVYNYVTDSTRAVSVTPNDSWGGEGLIGCGIGYGLLHKIPSRVADDEETVTPSVVQTVERVEEATAVAPSLTGKGCADPVIGVTVTAAAPSLVEASPTLQSLPSSPPMKVTASPLNQQYQLQPQQYQLQPQQQPHQNQQQQEDPNTGSLPPLLAETTVTTNYYRDAYPVAPSMETSVEGDKKKTNMITASVSVEGLPPLLVSSPPMNLLSNKSTSLYNPLSFQH
jgi:hypothetical protein